MTGLAMGGGPLNLGSVEGILIEPGAGSRSALREILWQVGVRKILQVEDVPPAGSDELANVDMIVIGVDDPGPDAVAMIGNVRQRASAANPFATVFATQFEPTHERIAGALAAGADTVLNKPLSIATLRQRMAVHVAGPRDWLVSASYIGPARASGPGSGSGTRIAAPHVVRMKATGVPADEIRVAVDSAWTDVARQRLLHSAYQIGFRVARAEAAPADLQVLADLKGVAALVRDLMPRVEPQERRFEAQVAADELLARIRNLPVSDAARRASLDAAVRLAAEILCLSVGKGQPERAAAEIRAAARAGVQ